MFEWRSDKLKRTPMSRLLAAAAIVVAFMGNAAAESPHDRQAPSGGLNFKEDCSAAPNGTGVPDKSANLSDQLSQSNGVICPPSGVDPKMAAPPREGGAMPVIPPPGTPGGDPNTVPK
jgi:hypothetical protein